MDKFHEIVEICRNLHLEFNISTRHYYVKIKQIQEVLAIFKSKNIQYILTPEALKGYNEDVIFKKETLFFRSEKFDPSVLKERVQLYDYQKEDVERELQKSNNFLLHEPGIGKCIHGDEKIIVQVSLKIFFQILAHLILTRYETFKSCLYSLWKGKKR
jgi:hypothetical protein